MNSEARVSPAQDEGRDARPPLARWELGVLAGAVILALLLGGLNLGVPSLWHDEAVHVFVAKTIVETGQSRMLSGRPCPSGAAYNYLLAGVMAVFGDSEAAVRFPSVLLAGVCVVLTFVLVRRLLGRGTAAVAAVALAVSPWSVAWSREARFYTLQQALYLAMLLLVWHALTARRGRRAWGWGAGACGAYLAGIATSLHSILFLGPVGAYACAMAAHEIRARARWRSRWAVAGLLVAGIGAATAGGYYVALPQADRDAIFTSGGLDGTAPEPARDRDRADPLYYPRFFANNLSTGYLFLAGVGFGLMLWKEGRRGLFAALAFLVPICALSYMGYRRFRFLYFAFPLYTAAFSYALIRLAQFAATARRSRWRMAGAVVLVAFGARLALSTAYLLGDSIEAAGGAHTTLARRHPQWREPCQYVREHAGDGAILTTTYLPVLYYVGRVDDWY
ncbi:MAG: glycosyltransferase family 39 protein, partial [Candidatus Hydrogenedentes bacterium]|nr:glycosyltransferase family 39 protein [Candidatus Hydrogenedentota bacterium]